MNRKILVFLQLNKDFDDVDDDYCNEMMNSL